MKISLGLCLLCLAVAAVSAGVRWPEAQTTENMADASLEFGWKSYRGLGVEPGKNVFFSPYSITNALSMLILGSTGLTEVDLLTAISAPDEISTRQIHEQLRDENARLSAETNATIGVANRFFVEQSVVNKVLPKFTNNLREFYNATLEPTPFATNPSDARKKINDFVSEATRGQIPSILVENPEDRTKLSLVNAIYFKGLWTRPFNVNDTSKLPFHAKSGDVQADFMKFSSPTRLPYAECDNGDCKLVALAYTNQSRYALIAIVPKEGLTLEALEARLDHQKLRTLLRAADDQLVDVFVPKFSLKNRFLLRDLITNLGAINVFGNAGAENSKIFSEAVDTKLVDEVIHEAKVEVNEEGTTAAAATATGIIRTSQIPSRTPKLVQLDRPFIFLIADVSNGFVLFWGRIENPTLSN